LQVGLYPCDPCDPWSIPAWFLDHGLHGLHGWAGHGRQHVGWERASQSLRLTGGHPLGGGWYRRLRRPIRRGRLSPAAVGELHDRLQFRLRGPAKYAGQ
jgi:hypothetical protein